MGPDGPKWGQEDFFPTNPDLADILGRTYLDFENLYFLFFFRVPNFWLGPSLGPPTWAPRGPTRLGPMWAHPLGEMIAKKVCDASVRPSSYQSLLAHEER